MGRVTQHCVFWNAEAATVASCGGRAETESPSSASATEATFGEIELGLLPVAGVAIPLVRYAVTNGATPPAVIAEGTFKTQGSGGQARLGLSLPVGTGYRASVSAVSAESDKITCEAAAGPFDVSPTAVKHVELMLTCHDGGAGLVSPVGQVETAAPTSYSTTSMRRR